MKHKSKSTIISNSSTNTSELYQAHASTGATAVTTQRAPLAIVSQSRDDLERDISPILRRCDSWTVVASPDVA